MCVFKKKVTEYSLMPVQKPSEQLDVDMDDEEEDDDDDDDDAMDYDDDEEDDEEYELSFSYRVVSE